MTLATIICDHLALQGLFTKLSDSSSSERVIITGFENRPFEYRIYIDKHVELATTLPCSNGLTWIDYSPHDPELLDSITQDIKAHLRNHDHKLE